MSATFRALIAAGLIFGGCAAATAYAGSASIQTSQKKAPLPSLAYNLQQVAGVSG
jgi:hypothetical protein